MYHFRSVDVARCQFCMEVAHLSCKNMLKTQKGRMFRNLARAMNIHKLATGPTWEGALGYDVGFLGQRLSDCTLGT